MSARQVVWTARAQRSYAQIVRYIYERNPATAIEVGRRLREAANALGIHPTGRKGKVAGTHVKSVANLPYIVVYRLNGRQDRVEILDLVHTRRDAIPGVTA